MLKSGMKRRRTHQQVEEQRIEEAAQKQRIQEKLALLEATEQKYQEEKANAEENKTAAIILMDMINKGVLE